MDDVVDKLSDSCEEADAIFASSACRAAAAAANRPALDLNSRLRSGNTSCSKSSPERGRLPRVRRPLLSVPSPSVCCSLELRLASLCLATSKSCSLPVTLPVSCSFPWDMLPDDRLGAVVTCGVDCDELTPAFDTFDGAIRSSKSMDS